MVDTAALTDRGSVRCLYQSPPSFRSDPGSLEPTVGVGSVFAGRVRPRAGRPRPSRRTPTEGSVERRRARFFPARVSIVVGPETEGSANGPGSGTDVLDSSHLVLESLGLVQSMIDPELDGDPLRAHLPQGRVGLLDRPQDRTEVVRLQRGRHRTRHHAKTGHACHRLGGRPHIFAEARPDSNRIDGDVPDDPRAGILRSWHAVGERGPVLIEWRGNIPGLPGIGGRIPGAMIRRFRRRRGRPKAGWAREM